MAAMLEYLEQTHRLALGMEILDALSRGPVVYPVRVDLEYGIPHVPPHPREQYRFSQLRGQLPRAMNRHDNGRYSLIYQPGFGAAIDLRIYDHQRQYIPRRMRVPLVSLAAVLDIEANEEADYSRGRVRRPVLFPGAAYDLPGKATGLRGRVLRDGKPMPWTRVEAYSVSDNELVGRARGDERGEFLLLLDPRIALDGVLSATFRVTVRIFGPAEIPVPPNSEVPLQDPLWNLPLEVTPAPGELDQVSSGESRQGDVEGAAAEVEFEIGRVLTGVDVDDFVFSLP